MRFHRHVSTAFLALGVAFVPWSVQAQQPRQGGAQTGQAPDVLPPASGAPASDAPTEKKATVTPAAGYAYADKPAVKSAPRSHYRGHGPTVNMPGFEPLPDGGSRLFVQLSQSVPVEERKAQGSITYVLKGANPRVWNNTNALVTVHFNTPVARARLVPQGADLLFIVELRALATPAWKMGETQDKTAMLSIDFPKGEYLNGGDPIPIGTPEAPPRAKGRGRAPAAKAAPKATPPGPTP